MGLDARKHAAVDWHPTQPLVVTSTRSGVQVFDDDDDLALRATGTYTAYGGAWNPVFPFILGSGFGEVALFKVGDPLELTQVATSSVGVNMRIGGIAWHPDGYLAASSGSGKLVLYGVRPATSEMFVLHEVPHPAESAHHGVRFSDDGRWLGVRHDEGLDVYKVE